MAVESTTVLIDSKSVQIRRLIIMWFGTEHTLLNSGNGSTFPIINRQFIQEIHNIRRRIINMIIPILSVDRVT